MESWIGSTAIIGSQKQISPCGFLNIITFQCTPGA